MNPELYERYLAKKAKKLGISVEELKAQNSPSSNLQKAEEKPQYIQQTIQSEIEKHESIIKPETVKSEVPSYIFGPSKIEETNTYSQQSAPEIKDNRENKFGLIGYPLGHSLSKVIHEAGFKSLGVEATYDILETPPDNLVDRIKFLKANGYKGFNVTIPLKLPVSLFVKDLSDST